MRIPCYMKLEHHACGACQGDIPSHMRLRSQPLRLHSRPAPDSLAWNIADHQCCCICRGTVVLKETRRENACLIEVCCCICRGNAAPVHQETPVRHRARRGRQQRRRSLPEFHHHYSDPEELSSWSRAKVRVCYPCMKLLPQSSDKTMSLAFEH